MKLNRENAGEVIGSSYLFNTFNQTDLFSIVEMATCRMYEPGEVIFEQGANAVSLFIISYGSVGLKINDYEDYESHPVILATGETFGESHYHLREKRIGSATARERTEIYEIRYDKLSHFLELIPSLELKFTKALALHLGSYCHHLMEGMMNYRRRLFVNEGISSFV